ncbi:MAG: FAD-dependent oxidoreductase [Ghiorsea sp.]|nr:FAD-dependent oxidoreductase [Ghiorsea sp.]
MFSTQKVQASKPIIIIGNGLAGCVLAWTLTKQGTDVVIYGDKSINASRVAAGIINPIIGQRFTLGEHVPNMLDFAKAFYQKIEVELNIQCYHPTPMQRLFSSPKEQENIKKRLKLDRFTPFFTKNDISQQLKPEHSGIVQQQTAWLDTNVLLDALHHYFEQKNIISYQPYTPQSTPNIVVYCEGYHMMHNPLFSWLPLQPAHGEIISCTTKQVLAPDMINQGKWLLPTTPNTCRVGATYDTALNTPTVRASSKQQLLIFANSLFKTNPKFKVIQHQAGIRPTTLDKQPFIGFHPKHQNTAIFNGFGSRGSLLIPWYSQRFTQSLRNRSAIPAEANIDRFCDKHHWHEP